MGVVKAPSPIAVPTAALRAGAKARRGPRRRHIVLIAALLAWVDSSRC